MEQVWNPRPHTCMPQETTTRLNHALFVWPSGAELSFRMTFRATSVTVSAPKTLALRRYISALSGLALRSRLLIFRISFWHMLIFEISFVKGAIYQNFRLLSQDCLDCTAMMCLCMVIWPGPPEAPTDRAPTLTSQAQPLVHAEVHV